MAGWANMGESTEIAERWQGGNKPSSAWGSLFKIIHHCHQLLVMTAVPWCECFFLLAADAADATDRAAVKADDAGDDVAFALDATEQWFNHSMMSMLMGSSVRSCGVEVCTKVVSRPLTYMYICRNLFDWCICVGCISLDQLQKILIFTTNSSTQTFHSQWCSCTLF